MTTLQEFIDQNEITAEVVGIDERSDAGREEWNEADAATREPSRHFRVTLHREVRDLTDPGAESVPLAEVEFSQGSAWTTDPTAKDVLYSLTSDVATVAEYDDDGRSSVGTAFERWAEDFGLSTDSRRAEATFLLIRKHAADLLEWLGALTFDQLVYQVDWINE
jgi:hypothetical protein